jgi:3-oxoadipate enol-lactonase
MPWASVDGTRLYYRTQGKGPPLVFAHGAGGNHLSWWQQVPHFAERYRCITFDQRAFGRTIEPPDGPGRRAFADDLRALLDELGVEETALVAQSMGGRTAVGLALRNPGRVRALVLAGTTGGAVTDEIRALQEDHRQSALGRRSLQARAISPAFRRRRPDLAYLYAAIGRMNPPRPRDYLAPPPPSYRGSSAPALAALGIPILFLVGEHDAITPPHIIRMAQQQVAGSRFAQIDDAGHSTYFEQPAAFNNAVETFLREAGWAPEGG